MTQLNCRLGSSGKLNVEYQPYDLRLSGLNLYLHTTKLMLRIEQGICPSCEYSEYVSNEQTTHQEDRFVCGVLQIILVCVWMEVSGIQ